MKRLNCLLFSALSIIKTFNENYKPISISLRSYLGIALRGATGYLFKRLKRSRAQLNFKKNGSVLFLRVFLSIETVRCLQLPRMD